MINSESAVIGQPSVRFLGGTESILGSMYLLEFGSHRFLFDCGREIHSRFPRTGLRSFGVDPASIDAVFLSHSHVDHCGNLPYLVSEGFIGPVYCTPATRDLTEVVLLDSARIHENEFARTGRPSGFDSADVEDAIEQFVTVDYESETDVLRIAKIRLLHSAHVLGSCMFQLDFDWNGKSYRFVFTGDMGRFGLPIVGEPTSVPSADMIVCESTYGGRIHDSFQETIEQFTSLIKRTVERQGKVLVPAFSLGRTHLVLHCLRHWMATGLVPELPIYIDSPLAQVIEEVYQEHQSADYLSSGIEFEWLESKDDAWYRTTQRESSIIIASGGMCEGGRILDHLKVHIDDPRCSLALVSHQSPNSIGAQMLAPTPKVRFHGREWNKWIEVAKIGGFSGHADTDDLKRLLADAASDTGKICLVHGETLQKETLEQELKQLGFNNVLVPSFDQRIDL
ncbi:MAG: MBL fold metallo-hydrolase [Pirellula sp.]